MMSTHSFNLFWGARYSLDEDGMKSLSSEEGHDHCTCSARVRG
jgi:hypothetical protein